MPSYVIPDKCDGCKALDKTACQYICPNDLMVHMMESVLRMGTTLAPSGMKSA